MKTGKRLCSILLCSAALLQTAGMPKTVNAEGGLTMQIIIDGSHAELAANKRWRGAGMVSANNSSRLLLDYKTEQPEAYWEILEYLFGENGAGICHLKVEMGSDVNSSSGTEPCIMRTEDETPDVTRGAGFQLAADALKINPELTLDMLWWSEPLWVTNADDVYAARYKWYKATLDAAYAEYGLQFQYVSAVRNERSMDADWVKYLSEHLKAERDCPYDYAAIRLVAADEVGTWNIASQMLEDAELCAAVDVLGSHYTSWSSSSAQTLANLCGKELWFSEGCAPMSYAQGTYRYDGTGSGMNDINGLLDIANRIITMVPGGGMTLYEYQPAVAAYYDGVTYGQKQLILANEPWSGSYLLDGGFYMSLHFSQFIRKGWAIIGDACHGDGTAGGDGHAIVDAAYSFLTAADPDTGDYSTVITNTTNQPITYTFTVKNLDKAEEPVSVWETRGPDAGAWDENYFRFAETVKPTVQNGESTYAVTVKPYSLVTVSTVKLKETEYSERESAILALPYADDFEYEGYAADYLSARGNAPRYMTDEGGAFEVQLQSGNHVLMQMITPESKAVEWGYTPEPTTNFGDDRWYNYSVSADVLLERSDASSENYAGIGLRYHLASAGASGYWVQLFADGRWNLKCGGTTLAGDLLEQFDSSVWHNLKIEAVNAEIKVWIDGARVAFCAYSPDCSAGRAALYSSWNQNCYDNILVEAAEGAAPYVMRYDDTDSAFSYAGSWTHTTMSSFTNYKRTISEGDAGAELTLHFTGTGFALTGALQQAEIAVTVDGETVCDSAAPANVGSREVTYAVQDLSESSHIAVVKVLSGTFAVDSAQITLAADAADTVVQTAPKQTKQQLPLLPVGIGAGMLAAGSSIAAAARKKRKH